MDEKVQAIAKRFAEYVVGAMLERSGAEFFHGGTVSGNKADFLVRDGDRFVAIEVKHTADPKHAGTVWKQWLDRKADKAAAAVAAPHLVIVTGAGDIVFADEATAPLLVPDNRTTLSILTPPMAMQQRA